MPKYLVGIDGSSTADPQYWRDRNELIVAENSEKAKEKWIQRREGWLREDEIPFIETREIPCNVQTLFASEYTFTPRGVSRVKSRCSVQR
jgi:hypothetical protein